MIKLAWKEVSDVASKYRQVGLRMEEDLWKVVQRDATKSGWTLSEQIRAELRERRGLWKQPSMPHRGRPKKPVVSTQSGRER